MANDTQNTRKPPFTWKDGVTTYLMFGVEKLAERLEDHTNASDLVGRMIEEFESNGLKGDKVNPLKALKAQIDSEVSSGQRGRKPVEIGDVRPFKVQAVEDSEETFIRLPIRTLNATKGNYVKASFENDRIVLTVA